MKKHNVWKKVLAYTFALALAAAPLTSAPDFASKGAVLTAGAAEAAEEPAAVPDEIVRDGITYYNVNSPNFNVNK